MQRCMSSVERWQIIVDADNRYNTHSFKIRLKFPALRRNSGWIKARERESRRGWQRCLLSFFLTLWRVTFNKVLSQYVTSYRYSFNFCLDCNDSQGFKWSYKTGEKSGHWNAKYAFIFSSLSPFSSDDFKQSCIPAWAAGGEAAALAWQRGRLLWKCNTLPSAGKSNRQAGRHIHTQTHTYIKIHTRKQADEPAESETNLSNLIRKLIIENKLHSWTCLLFIHSLLRLDKLLFYTEQK